MTSSKLNTCRIHRFIALKTWAEGCYAIDCILIIYSSWMSEICSTVRIKISHSESFNRSLGAMTGKQGARAQDFKNMRAKEHKGVRTQGYKRASLITVCKVSPPPRVQGCKGSSKPDVLVPTTECKKILTSSITKCSVEVAPPPKVQGTRAVVN